MVFDYFRTITALDSITIDDIGNTCINAINDNAEEWFLVVHTYEGWTEIKEFGPLIVDTNDLPTYFEYRKYAYEFNEKKLGTTIDKFINNPKRMITQVSEVEKDFVKSRLNIVRDKL